MQNFINLGKDEKQQADLFRETEASTMYPPEKNSKTSKSTLLMYYATLLQIILVL